MSANTALPASENPLEEVELILQFLSDPANLTNPEGNVIRAHSAERALIRLHEYLESSKAA